ncbi:hypothetical protein E5288_WYG014908 [Bos mutus]|uniref:Uncharacterized protein n=1 Tax=Bos mutus TaxID=72004 RepID=A0A6B0S3M3_9CETA|nr:hypothetical protein [Bos mutus]
MTWLLLLRKRHFRKMVVPASTSSRLKLTRPLLSSANRKPGSRQTPLSFNPSLTPSPVDFASKDMEQMLDIVHACMTFRQPSCMERSGLDTAVGGQAAAQVFGKGSDWQAAPRVRTKSSRRSPQLSEQLLQSERKGSAGAPRKMLEGSPTQPPDTWWWSPGHPGPEMGTVCFRVKSETRYSARFGGSYTKTKPRALLHSILYLVYRVDKKAETKNMKRRYYKKEKKQGKQTLFQTFLTPKPRKHTF